MGQNDWGQNDQGSSRLGCCFGGRDPAAIPTGESTKLLQEVVHLRFWIEVVFTGGRYGRKGKTELLWRRVDGSNGKHGKNGKNGEGAMNCNSHADRSCAPQEASSFGHIR
jgi:hypothetical protein